MPIRAFLSDLVTTCGLGHQRSKLSNVRLLAICSVIFLTALGIRVLYWQDNNAELARGKKTSGLQLVSFFYYDQAQRILDDGGMLFPSKPVDAGDATVLTHPPGYSILMAGILKTFYAQDAESGVMQADAALRAIQIVCDAASSVVILLIAAELFPLAVAVIGALLCGFSPHLAYYSLMLAPDSLSVLPLLLAVFFMIRAIKHPRFGTVLAAGAFIGLSCWLRSNALLLAPFLACATPLLFERGKRLRYSLAVVAGAAIVVSPIVIRNWVVFHQIIPLSVTAGLNLVEGIGDYDKEDRFGMPSTDSESALKDVEWHGRPDYADSLWKPDGIERDKARFWRGVAVVRSNPGWFLSVVLRRMEFMVRYNDSRQRDFPHLATAPTISDAPNFGYRLEVPPQMPPAWSSSTLDPIENGTTVSRPVQATDLNDSQILQIISDEGQPAELHRYPQIDVKPNTDYLFKLPVALEQGSANVKVGTDDPRIVLALVATSNAERLSKRKSESGDADRLDSTTLPPRMRILLVPFASGDNSQVRVSLFRSSADRTVMNVGKAELFEMGPTAYVWTKYPRAVIRAVQKNVFTTDVMRALMIAGLILLALTRRFRVLGVLLIVPLYFLLAQSPLSTEYRYILAIHYFLFVIAGATIYYASLVIGKSVGRGYQMARGKERSN